MNLSQWLLSMILGKLLACYLCHVSPWLLTMFCLAGAALQASAAEALVVAAAVVVVAAADGERFGCCRCLVPYTFWHASVRVTTSVHSRQNAA